MYFIIMSERDVLFRTRYLLWICYHDFSVRGLRLRQTCPFMVAFSMRPSLAPSQINLVLQLCWSCLWGFLCPCPPHLETRREVQRRRYLRGKGDYLRLLPLVWKSYFGDGKVVFSFPQCIESKQVDFVL